MGPLVSPNSVDEQPVPTSDATRPAATERRGRARVRRPVEPPRAAEEERRTDEVDDPLLAEVSVTAGQDAVAS